MALRERRVDQPRSSSLQHWVVCSRAPLPLTTSCFGDENRRQSIRSHSQKSRRLEKHTLLSYNVIGRPTSDPSRETLPTRGIFLPDAGLGLRTRCVSSPQRSERSLPPRSHHPSRGSARHFLRGVSLDRRFVQRRCGGARATFLGRARVSPGAVPGLVHWRLEPPTPQPTIDIIIPTRDRIDLVRPLY